MSPGYISVRKTAKVTRDEEKIPLKTAVNMAADVKPACFTRQSKMGKKSQRRKLNSRQSGEAEDHKFKFQIAWQGGGWIPGIV